MEDRKWYRRVCVVVAVCVLWLTAQTTFGQNYERYKPQDLPQRSLTTPDIPQTDASPANEDGRTLVKKLDAVIIIDDVGKVSLDVSIDTLEGLHYQFTANDSIVFRSGMKTIVNRYLGKPISLRSINELTRTIVKQYQRCGQPIVDVIIPEQRITGGTLQIVIIEARVGRVLIQPGCVFECSELDRWIECTRPGERVLESQLKSDLFWLNQNPFRRVSVDFQKGSVPGTTDVCFKSHDIAPVRGYLGADDTGVRSLNYGRFFAGFMYGDLFNRGGMLSYQYTTDQEFRLLDAHSVSYSQPLSRNYSFMLFGSHAAVSPDVGIGLTQSGESWQTGAGFIRHLIRSPERSQNLTAGVDFKSTNNNLEFAGATVVASNADLVQLHLGWDDLKRIDIDQYSLMKLDSYIGPGGGMTGANSTAAFQTIRPGTSPDYIYARFTAERTTLIDDDWMLLGRFTGQVASERLLFSETLGLGGFDTLRGYDQRSFNADHGWIANLEFGPKTIRWGCEHQPRSLRPYTFIDMGNGYLQNPLPGEDAYTWAMSSGAGFRFNVSDRLSARFDWGYGFQDLPGSPRDNRFHLGITWIPGKRP